MGSKGNGTKKTIRKKVCHCQICGRTQSDTNAICEGCGNDMGLYGSFRYIEIEADEWELGYQDNIPDPEEESRRQEEENRRREQQRQEEARYRQEKQRQEEEVRRRQEKQQQDEEARRRQLEQRQEENNRRRQQKQQAEEDRRRARKEKKQKDTGSVWKKLGKAVAVLFAVCCSSVVLLAVIGLMSRQKCGPELEWSFDADTGVLTVTGTGEMDSFNPVEDSLFHPLANSELEEAPWMEDHRLDITSVVIGDEVTSIGRYAFAGCKNLDEVTFGASLKNIENNAFDAASLKNVWIPDSVTRIGAAAFNRNPQLDNLFVYSDPVFVGDILTWDDDVAIISRKGGSAQDYAERSGLVFVDLDAVSDTYSVGGSAGGYQFWELNLIDRAMTLKGSGAMEDFNGTWMLDNEENRKAWVENRNLPYWSEYRHLIKRVIMENGITSIGESAFESCVNLEAVEFNTTLESIGFQSFLATAVANLKIPEGVTKIDCHAFNFCESLVYVKLPESLKELQDGTFNMCNALYTLHIGGNTVIQRTEGSSGVFRDGNNPDGRPHKLTIHADVGSDAHKYAAEEGFNFIATGYLAGVEDTGKCGDSVTWRYSTDDKTLYLEGWGNTWAYYMTPKELEEWGYSRYPKRQIRVDEETGWWLYTDYIEHIVVGEGVKQLSYGLFGRWEFDNNMVNLKTVDLGNVQQIHANLKNTRLEKLVIPETVVHLDVCNFADNMHLKTVEIYSSAELPEVLFYNCPVLGNLYFYGDASIADGEEGDLFNGLDLNPVKTAPGMMFHVKKDSAALRYAIRNNILYTYMD